KAQHLTRIDGDLSADHVVPCDRIADEHRPFARSLAPQKEPVQVWNLAQHRWTERTAISVLNETPEGHFTSSRETLRATLINPSVEWAAASALAFGTGGEARAAANGQRQCLRHVPEFVFRLKAAQRRIEEVNTPCAIEILVFYFLPRWHVATVVVD